MRVRSALPFLLPLVLVAAACSLPTDERATPYDRDDLPPAIANTTTTSSTTTTTTSTIAPPTSDGSLPGASTTTSPLTATVPIDLYYTIGFSDDLARLKRELQEGASIPQVIAQLETPLGDVAEFSLRTSVRRGMVTGDVVVDRGTATVNLDSAIVADLTETNLRRAIAQLVLTLTSFQPPDNGGIGKVRFELDGEGFEVFVPAFGGSSEPGEELAFSDFSSLIATTATATTTSNPTSTTTTTTTTTTTDVSPTSDG